MVLSPPLPSPPNLAHTTTSLPCAPAGAGAQPPLWLLCLLRGGPLMPCLRLLLANDSLMDITARRQLYTPLLQLLTTMAGEVYLGFIWGHFGFQNRVFKQ